MKRFITFTALTLSLAITSHSFAEELKVVPGSAIQPESPQGAEASPDKAKPTPVRKKKKAAAPASGVKAGKTFIIELSTALSSSANKAGDKIYFQSSEDVGTGKPVILRGAVGEGRVVESKQDKNGSSLKAQLERIEAANGEMVGIEGEIASSQNNGPALLKVGERFSATVPEKISIRSSSKPAPKSEDLSQGFASVNLKSAKIDSTKGKYSGKVEVIIEGPKGVNVEDIDPASVVLYKVNGMQLPSPVRSSGNAKKGDKNKNATQDWTVYFDAWSLAQWLRAGNNQVVFKANSKSGPFEAAASVEGK